MAELEGLAALEAELARRIAQIEGASNDAMADNAYHLLGEAIRRAPIELGDLRGSGDIRVVGEGEYEVGFWGQGVKAVVQHERLDFHHPRGGQAKYLEGPFAENIDRYVQHVADSVKRVL